MKRLICFRYYRSFRVQCICIVAKNGERKCQQNSNVNVNKSAKVRRLSKIHFHTYERKGNKRNAILSSLVTLKQCWNEFIFCSAPEPNKVLRLISVEKIPWKAVLYPAKVFQLPVLRSEKIEYGKSEDRGMSTTRLSSLFNG